ALILDHASVNQLSVTPSSWPNASTKNDDGASWEAPTKDDKVNPACSTVNNIEYREVPTNSQPLETFWQHVTNWRRIWRDIASLWSIFWRDWLYGKTYSPGTLVSMTDFHFKGFGLTYFCFESEKKHLFIKEDNTLNADNIVHWLESSKYSPSAFSIVQDLLNA